MHLTYQYKLRPNKSCIARLESILEQDRQLYNAALEERIKAYKFKTRCDDLLKYADTEEKRLAMLQRFGGTYSDFKKISLFQQMRSLTEIRHLDIGFEGSVTRQRGPLKKLDKAFQAFFRRFKSGEKPGFPRFKGKHRWDSIEINEGGGYHIRNKRFHSKDFPGGISIRWYRGLPANLVKHCGATIKKTARGWFLNLRIEVPTPEKIEVPISEHGEISASVVGIDVGLTSLITTSDDERISPPKHYRKAEKKLRRLQRLLSRAKRGSKSRYKKRQLLARHHLKTANQRKNYHHHASRWLVNKHDLICAEDLNIRGMVRNRYLSKSISDAGWGGILDKIAYKAEEAGKRFVKVNPKDTSQSCSGCGKIVKKDLSDREHACPNCGLTIDRDLNAAINIRRAGMSLASLNLGLPEFDAETSSGFG